MMKIIYQIGSIISNNLFVGVLYSILLLPSLLITRGVITTVAASSEKGVSCFDRGFIDGEDHPFNQRTFDHCGDDYYQGFISGCVSVESNSRDTCESATDD